MRFYVLGVSRSGKLKILVFEIMSDGGKNVGKSRSKGADVRESASRSQYDPSGSVDKKGYSEDEYFDSGVQECCLSSDAFSETDLKYGDSAFDCDYDSKSLDKEDAAEERSSERSRELPKSKEDYKSQVSSQLDSGLDLQYEQDSSAAEVQESEGPASAPKDVRSSWDAFFEPDDEGNT